MDPGASAVLDRPSEYEQLRALGNLFELPEAVRPLFKPDEDFRPVAPPKSDDWLAVHNEAGQTFEEYRDADANRPDATRRTIYLLPLGDFPEDTSPALEESRTYAALFYQMEVRLLPAYYPHDLEFSPRTNPHGGQRQVLTTDVMDFLKTRLPADAYCLLGITMVDLYPSPSWNYVFGEASTLGRVGVYSLARYDPAFSGDDRDARYRDIILQRSCKVLVHETAHMFGLPHCIYFDCVVNGSNHLRETDRQPQHLCPVCLRKLHHATGFDPVRRYEQLARFYRARKWYHELDFVDRQLKRLPQP
jgi:archaemetzincin